MDLYKDGEKYLKAKQNYASAKQTVCKYYAKRCQEKKSKAKKSKAKKRKAKQRKEKQSKAKKRKEKQIKQKQTKIIFKFVCEF